jgi:hypothetical protein
MFLEYDWTSNAYRSHLGDAVMSSEHSFETLASARHALRIIGLRIGDKTHVCTWRIEFMEFVAGRDDVSTSAQSARFWSWANSIANKCSSINA